MRDITIYDLEKIMRTEFAKTNRTIDEILRLLKKYLPKIK